MFYLPNHICRFLEKGFSGFAPKELEEGKDSLPLKTFPGPRG